ncbi:Type I restriction-modification system, restriction subunit R [Anaerovibrio sp. JC8]|uniref:EcoAI/FtnUII family type I restriction enzme subunit R n=1 Tax=Anaerovibrio sp. JC8 TaxID=1240085 RepID=UPI000A0E4A25|nr:DEAD/DEAH box helicase family protein [Anaerovibrio sp. JC8]ORU00086.1 Type I restriction-modification system, restriction subunit R [Anaerovibrio sp. JC8]
MSTVLTIDQMTEEDIKLHFITPAIEAKWDRGKITMETKVTDGRINLRGNMASREKPKKADYLLYLSANNPIAVVEAKDHKHSVSYGLQQAMTYAQMLDLPFAYSSNGDGFVEHDFLTGKERTLALNEFPSEQELIERFKKEKNLTEKELTLIEQPYYSGMGANTPRYYQRIAVNRTLDAIALGQDRILLVMATGTGKTFTAFQIVYRLLKAGIKKKILYLADRNLLVDQSILQDFAPLDKTIHKINFSKDDKTTIGSYEVYFALYHQMVGNNGEERFRDYFDPDFFDLIIVDECHRGSAKEESRWRKVLEYFKGATQIGMTATPKETKYVSNINYFGEPLYTYSLNDGINDGFLAPFKVINITMDISDGWRPRAGQLDYYGNEIEDRIYNNGDYDYNLVLEDRTRMVAETITEYLKKTGRMQKTIVFCATEEHAERMRMALVNCNADMMQKNPDYVVRITGSDDYGKSKLDYFISVSAEYPVIATTSDLLSTGADCKMTKLIVLDKMINSMTTFKQIIGRGTRLRPNEGKMSFMVMDFRNVTRLFADPDWDGPIEINEGFTGAKKEKEGLENGGEKDPNPEPESPKDPRTVYYVKEDGCKVAVIHETVAVYDAGGKLLRQENIIDYTKTNILNGYASLEAFIRTWKGSERKAIMAEYLAKFGIDIDKLKREQNMAHVDDFDFICYIAYGKKPLTRKERANNIKKKDIFSKFSGTAKEILETLLDKYMDLGIKEIEKTAILKLSDFAKFGTPKKIAEIFGGKDKYLAAVQELKKDLYEDEVG